MADKTSVFQCCLCGGTFASDITDEQAMQETRARYGYDVEQADCEVVCDVCWDKTNPERN